MTTCTFSCGSPEPAAGAEKERFIGRGTGRRVHRKVETEISAGICGEAFAKRQPSLRLVGLAYTRGHTHAMSSIPPPSLSPRAAAAASLELFRLRLAGVLNWLDLAASGRHGSGMGDSVAAAAGGAVGAPLTDDPATLAAALDGCALYLLAGESSLQAERERLAAHGQRFGELMALRERVEAARCELAVSVEGVLALQAALDARAAKAAGALRRIAELREGGSREDPARIIAAAERYSHASIGEGPRRLPMVPDEAIMCAGQLFREQGACGCGCRGDARCVSIEWLVSLTALPHPRATHCVHGGDMRGSHCFKTDLLASSYLARTPHTSCAHFSPTHLSSHCNLCCCCCRPRAATAECFTCRARRHPHGLLLLTRRVIIIAGRPH